MLNNRRKSFDPIDALAFGLILFLFFAKKEEKPQSESFGWGWLAILIWIAAPIVIVHWKQHALI